MFCKNCGQKVEKVGKFCEHCGMETGIEIEQHNTIIASNTQNTSSKMTKKQKLILGSIAGIIILLMVISKIGQNLTSPEYVAKHYFDAISKANYETAFNFILLPQGDYVSKDNFTQYMNKRYGSTTWTENYKVEKGTDSKSKNSKSNDEEMIKTVSVSYVDKDSSSQTNMNIKLVRLKAKKLFLFDDWKVSLNDEMQREWRVSVPKGSSLFVNGKQIPKESIERERNVSYYSTEDSAKIEDYVVKNIFPGEYDLKVTIPGGKEYSKKHDSNYSVTLTAAADETLSNTIKNTIQGYSKSVEEYVKTKDLSKFKEFVVENSSAWKELSSFNTGTYEEITALTITLEKIEEVVLEDASHVKIKVATKWNATKKDYSGSEIAYDNSDTQTYYLKKENDKWFIYNID